MTIAYDDISNAELSEPQTSFLAQTNYLPLDTIKLLDDVKWGGLTFGRAGNRYIIDRDIPGKLVRRLINDGVAKPSRKLWENQESFSFEIRNKQLPISRIYVDQYSLTDFYSIPRLFHRIYSPTDIGHKAAHVHDVLCDESVVRVRDWNGQQYTARHPVDWRQSAKIFDEAQRVALVPAIAAKVKYWAVMMGGPRFEADDWSVYSGR